MMAWEKNHTQDIYLACDGTRQNKSPAISSHVNYNAVVEYLKSGQMTIFSDWDSDINPIQCVNLSCDVCKFSEYNGCATARRCIYNKLVKDKSHPELFV